MPMVFVPHLHQAPSPRAEALGRILAETVTEFRRTHSDISGHEIQQAMHVALMKSLEGRAGNPALAVAILASVALAAGVIAFAAQRQRDFDQPILLVPILIFVVLAVFFAVRFRRG